MKKWRYVGIMAFLVIGLTANAVFAGPTGVTQERSWLRTATKREKSPSRSTDLSLGKWAALVLLLGLGGVALYKRRRVSGRVITANVSTMRISAVTRISPKAQIVAVEVQGRVLLLGATDTHITRLGWLDDVTGNDTVEDEDESEDEVRVADVVSPTKLPARRERVAHLSNAKSTTGSAPLRKSSRFRELLADAIGLTPQTGSAPPPVVSAPVDELVAGAEDRYVGRDAQSIHTQRIRRESTNTAALIDVEGQAKGLVARLNRPSK